MANIDDGVNLLVSLINMGALIAFVVLHVAVIVHYVVRRRSTDLWSHLIMPLIGVTILIYVVINASILAQRLGLIWLGIGALILIILYALGRRPNLSGLTE